MADSHRASIRQFIAPNTFFLISSPPAGEDWGAWQQAVEALKLAGGKLAVDDTAAAEKTALACADLCVLDFRGYALENFERLLRRLTRGETPQTVAVNGLSAWAEHRLCMDRRATSPPGGFASQPDEAESGERLNPSRLVLIEMLNLLRRDADIAEIAAVAKRDPVVAVKVLAMANTPILGLSAPVANIDQAMLVLGRATLYRWLSVSMFVPGPRRPRRVFARNGPLAGTFPRTRRSRPAQREACDELFLVGLFSLLDSLLGMPMARVVERMTLPPAVREVLVDSSGPYVRHLMLALAVEKGRFDHASRVADMLGASTKPMSKPRRGMPEPGPKLRSTPAGVTARRR
ncbi:MAG: HDOD domain-containing protein [Betaproteobacteria bacterium]|uniref:HDOD domain-containing protein n=1 Tax=Candidatus Proximibacter danicus TaxID=2954365 RepID=A0A9D7PRF8_9PROT|nr:HDOD domain-containing protein [Candidatus Proximibacter danicus]